MSEPSERAVTTCPACGVDTVHEVLASGTPATVRCADCGHVHKARLDRPETVERAVVVSQDGESITATVEAPADETVAVGEEFILDTEEAIMAVRITDLEVGPEQRTDRAVARDVETFWTRAVENVSVPVTVHPADGSRDRTRSVTLHVPGDEEFEVDETVTYGDETFEIEGIHVRADAAGYPSTKLDRPGDAAPAKDVKRVLGHEAGPTAGSAWKGRWRTGSR